MSVKSIFTKFITIILSASTLVPLVSSYNHVPLMMIRVLLPDRNLDIKLKQRLVTEMIKDKELLISRTRCIMSSRSCSGIGSKCAELKLDQQAIESWCYCSGNSVGKNCSETVSRGCNKRCKMVRNLKNTPKAARRQMKINKKFYMKKIGKMKMMEEGGIN